MNNKKISPIALAETMEILENTEKKVIEKIPNSFINFIKENMDKEYKANIDFSKSDWEQSLQDETKSLIALIYRDYIVSKEEREILIQEEKSNIKKQEQELREKYNPDNLFKKKTTINKSNSNESTDEIPDNMQLTNVKDIPWYKKLIEKIMSIFGKKK